MMMDDQTPAPIPIVVLKAVAKPGEGLAFGANAELLKQIADAIGDENVARGRAFIVALSIDKVEYSTAVRLLTVALGELSSPGGRASYANAGAIRDEHEITPAAVLAAAADLHVVSDRVASIEIPCGRCCWPDQCQSAGYCTKAVDVYGPDDLPALRCEGSITHPPHAWNAQTNPLVREIDIRWCDGVVR